MTRIVEMIEEAGGSVRCRCRLVDLDVSGGRVRAVTLRSEDPETGIVTEERVQGEVFFKCMQVGDTSHLYAGGEPVSSSGLFPEIYGE